LGAIVLNCGETVPPKARAVVRTEASGRSASFLRVDLFIVGGL
jgi:hypothetical protein